MNKIKIPKTVRIGAYEYSIKYRKGLVKHAKSTGQCYTSDACIWIDPDEMKQVRDVTILHELLHCVGDVEIVQFGEGEIDRIAHCLARIFKDDFNIEFDWSDIKG